MRNFRRETNLAIDDHERCMEAQDICGIRGETHPDPSVGQHDFERRSSFVREYCCGRAGTTDGILPNSCGPHAAVFRFSSDLAAGILTHKYDKSSWT